VRFLKLQRLEFDFNFLVFHHQIQMQKNFIRLSCALIACSFTLMLPMTASSQTAYSPGVSEQLLISARSADLKGIVDSLEHGAAPNSRNRFGKTALFTAIEKNRIDIVKVMLEHGVDVDLASLEKVTPLMAAAYSGNSEIVELLLNKKPKLEEEDRVHKSALIYACGMGNTQVAAQLINAGAKIDAAYADALTPLMWAAGQGHLDTVKLLIEKGANAALKDDRGLTALEIARTNKKTDVLDYLSSLKK
jgi:uncharacterized protein